MISPTSTSAGCSIANTMARAIASGEMANQAEQGMPDSKKQDEKMQIGVDSHERLEPDVSLRGKSSAGGLLPSLACVICTMPSPVLV